ncbi:MAG: hypothetical protein E7317_00290 [Clostridiales bacterium]|nr:hypothetical protein [Clostridiales bacterium]
MKTVTRKIVCAVVIAVLLLASSTTGLTETKSGSFTSSLISALRKSQSITEKDWYGTSENRAGLTVLLLIEASSDSVLGSTDLFYGGLYNTSYCGKSNDGLVVGASALSGDIIIFSYDASRNSATYTLFTGEQTNSLSLESLVSAVTGGDYYANASKNIKSWVDMLGNI